MALFVGIATAGSHGGAASWRAPERVRIGHAVEAPYAHVDPAGRVTGESPEVAAPFTGPSAETSGQLGYGAFAFRPADREPREAWNDELARYVGSPEHHASIARFGFTAGELPGSVRTADVLGSFGPEPRT